MSTHFVVQMLLGRLAHTFFAGTQRPEVFACFRRQIIVELEDNPSEGERIQRDVEVTASTRIRHLWNQNKKIDKFCLHFQRFTGEIAAHLHFLKT